MSNETQHSRETAASALPTGASPGAQTAQAALCTALLPVWGRHLAASRTQSEGAVAEMLSAFAEIGPHLDRAARQSQQITAALAQDEGGIINLAQACAAELEPVLAQLDGPAVVTLRKVLGMVTKSVFELEQLAKPFEHETQMVSRQVERMYVGFQYQDRISQMMTLLYDDMVRLQAVLTDPGADAQTLDQTAWLARLELQYVMQDQRNAEPPAADGIETTFF
jgi:methyl-accepting chemotaxis protein